MDPYQEQRLREEVMYLHSLWHRGPPRSQNPIPNPYFLRPTTFVRRGYLPPVKRSRIQREYSDPGIDWSCKIRKDTRRATAPGWPSVSIQSSSQPRSLTPEEQARMDSIQAQKAALKAVSDFLSCRYNADGEGNEDECIDEFEEGDMDDTTEGEGCRNFDFFEKLYETDSALREYYVMNYAGGEFSCLVCYAVGKRSVKKYKDCLALVQHSVSVTKTKGRQAHRAYGQSICKIIGWDINQLPSSIASSLQNKLGPSSNNLVDGQENNNGSFKDALTISGSHAEVVTIDNGGSAPFEENIDNGVKDDLKPPDSAIDILNGQGDEMSFQNKSFSIDNWQDNTRSESAVLEGNIENCVKDGLKHPDSAVDVVNGNVGELFPQNKSSNIDSSQDNSGSKSAVLDQS
ncbi:hypothetical protein DM860_014823 [Cuscuta australis]|uniref:Uncharacterized protein n=1 Tax=Cuscuta australis TaxID=267555 RepID=A0A328DIT3_9ASTE|nr:hypothetical protein DM860_014823 [Cuscuta australis]